jgi:hypothetical protein
MRLKWRVDRNKELVAGQRAFLPPLLLLVASSILADPSSPPPPPASYGVHDPIAVEPPLSRGGRLLCSVCALNAAAFTSMGTPGSLATGAYSPCPEVDVLGAWAVLDLWGNITNAPQYDR